MTTEPMFTPPTSDLIRQWMGKAGAYQQEEWYYEANLVTQAAEWGYQQGADAELNECCEWVVNTRAYNMTPGALRAVRRPKPPSLKEQALMALEDGDIGPGASLTPVEVCIIRRALQQIND